MTVTNDHPNSDRVIVIDASVAIKWFVIEEGHEKAREILAQVLSNPQDFVVPELFFFELANIINRVVIEDSDVRLSLFEELLDLGLLRSYFSKELAPYVRKFQKLGLSGYDASYVALAELSGGVWVTADKIAHNKIAKFGISRLL